MATASATRPAVDIRAQIAGKLRAAEARHLAARKKLAADVETARMSFDAAVAAQFAARLVLNDAQSQLQTCDLLHTRSADVLRAELRRTAPAAIQKMRDELADKFQRISQTASRTEADANSRDVTASLLHKLRGELETLELEVLPDAELAARLNAMRVRLAQASK